MHKRYLVAGYRIFFGLLALVAMAVQFYHGLQNGASSVNFFSFFTIQSNLLAATVFMVTGALLFKAKKFDLSQLRSATTFYMIAVGIIFVLLLTEVQAELQTTIPWVNSVLHHIMPVVVLLDWLIDRPQKAIGFKRGLVWLVFPLAYAAYSLIRGHFTGWYPYPFLNVDLHGYMNIVITSLVIAGAMLLLVLAMTSATRYVSRRRKRA